MPSKSVVQGGEELAVAGCAGRLVRLAVVDGQAGTVFQLPDLHAALLADGIDKGVHLGKLAYDPARRALLRAREELDAAEVDVRIAAALCDESLGERCVHAELVAAGDAEQRGDDRIKLVGERLEQRELRSGFYCEAVDGLR